MSDSKQIILNWLKASGAGEGLDISVPPKTEMGDWTWSTFELAKSINQNPVELALSWATKAESAKILGVAKVMAMGPYVNFFLDPVLAAKAAIDAAMAKDPGSNTSGRGRKVLFEYPSQNTHKEFHVGHLRNVCIGNTLVSLYRKNGYDIIPVNYINDFGAHVVKCLWGIINLYKGQVPKDNRQKWLGQVYAEASKYIKEHELEAKPALDELQKRLEAQDPKIMDLFKQTRGWSLSGFEKIHQELGVVHKHLFLESEVKARGQELVNDLLKKGVAEVGEGGAIIINLDKYGLDVALLRKSTGAGVYMTSDLALAETKFDKFGADESVNITGTEQEFYFRQLFKVLELMGRKNKMVHVGYGLVNLPEGKMSSRAGNVILYEDLRDLAVEQLTVEVAKRHADWSRKKVDKTAKVLAMAALKFTLDQHEATKTVVFDLKNAISFEGYSAPYILYVVARIESIAKKALWLRFVKPDYSAMSSLEEKKLVSLLSGYNEVIIKAFTNYNPSVMAKYCFDLAQAYNDFYSKKRIVGAESRVVGAARLRLSLAVSNILKDALKVLSVDTLKEM